MANMTECLKYQNVLISNIRPVIVYESGAQLSAEDENLTQTVGAIVKMMCAVQPIYWNDLIKCSLNAVVGQLSNKNNMH